MKYLCGIVRLFSVLLCLLSSAGPSACLRQWWISIIKQEDTGLTVSLIFIPTGTITELTPLSAPPPPSTHLIVNNTKGKLKKTVVKVLIGFLVFGAWTQSGPSARVTVRRKEWLGSTCVKWLMGQRGRMTPCPSGSELNHVHCSGLIHKSIVANEVTLKRNVNL